MKAAERNQKSEATPSHRGRGWTSFDERLQDGRPISIARAWGLAGPRCDGLKSFDGRLGRASLSQDLKTRSNSRFNGRRANQSAAFTLLEILLALALVALLLVALN